MPFVLDTSSTHDKNNAAAQQAAQQEQQKAEGGAELHGVHNGRTAADRFDLITVTEMENTINDESPLSRPSSMHSQSSIMHIIDDANPDRRSMTDGGHVDYNNQSYFSQWSMQFRSVVDASTDRSMTGLVGGSTSSGSYHLIFSEEGVNHIYYANEAAVSESMDCIDPRLLDSSLPVGGASFSLFGWS